MSEIDRICIFCGKNSELYKALCEYVSGYRRMWFEKLGISDSKEKWKRIRDDELNEVKDNEGAF